ncbi:uncharacterized protein J8A68_004564 [[Candida] subhashii]|uniref:Uncharacterized protein n=1 Tax=[Candida] subhashii TaxID=561895 RepID=A0A8J5QIY1_9ASCO|nr:uncharacterized protein J8A68_004564 [[Candida] subhashii]KAG7661961.1 hypothetical protein J8A68_004564 [[Candida] subhashii]
MSICYYRIYDWISNIDKLSKLDKDSDSVIESWKTFFENFKSFYKGIDEYLDGPYTFDCRSQLVIQLMNLPLCGYSCSIMIDFVCKAVLRHMVKKELIPEETYPPEGPLTLCHVWGYIVGKKLTRPESGLRTPINPDYPFSVYINPSPDPESNIVFRTSAPYDYYGKVTQFSKEQYINEYRTKIALGRNFDYLSEINDPEFFRNHSESFNDNFEKWGFLAVQLPRLGEVDYTIIVSWKRFLEYFTSYYRGIDEYLASPDTFDCRRLDHHVYNLQGETPMRTSFYIDSICSLIVDYMIEYDLIAEELYPTEGQLTLCHVWNYIAPLFLTRDFFIKRLVAFFRQEDLKRMGKKRRAKRKWFVRETGGKRPTKLHR